MNKKVIVVDGYLASGKSTFAAALSAGARLPCFIKDTFKSALCQSVEIRDRAESSQFSAVTFDAMVYVAERLFEAGLPLILEGNFLPAGVKKTDEAGVLRDLIERYGYTPLTFWFTGDTKILYQRFVEREKSPERGEANRMNVPFSQEDFDRCCRNLEGFSLGGEVVRVDTTDFSKVDFPALIKEAGDFINGI